MKKTVVFDLGGVLIDWNPRYLYRSIFENENEMEHFLANICTNEWNELQDAGRSLDEATEVLCTHFPEYDGLIRQYYGQWQKMLNGPIPGTVHILSTLKENNYRLLALTNWSNETFPVALELYDFLHWFEGILVSGKEKMKKPDPAIFNLLIRRYGLKPAETIYIDDSQKNVHAAAQAGFDAVHFRDPGDLLTGLADRGVMIGQVAR